MARGAFAQKSRRSNTEARISELEAGNGIAGGNHLGEEHQDSLGYQGHRREFEGERS